MDPITIDERFAERHLSTAPQQLPARQRGVAQPVTKARDQQSVLVIIPAYNEREAIRHVVRRVRMALPSADVLVIDDGSTDDTALQARLAGACVLRHPFNLGIGGAVQSGLKFARRQRHDFVLRVDGDGQHEAEDLRLLLDTVQSGRADVAIGSRFLGGAEANMKISPLRRIGITLFRAQVSWLTRQTVTDTTSGMLAMNRRAVEVLARYMPQDYPEVEGRIILYAGGLTTVEVPVRMHERIAGTSSIRKWRSAYYAVKVSVAVLLTAVKHHPEIRMIEEPAHATAAAYSSSRP
jgi:glycosyltransferase involved in cell wall biosynthesis